MRAVDGPCGHHLEAEDDERLVEAVKAHAAEAHPEMGLTEDQIRDMVSGTAFDKSSS
jgi:predicted small metal-binding protein